MHPPILQVSGLSVRRGKTDLLRNIDWTVERGQHWVLLGSNGSGKTSLLRTLAGYLSPTEGAMRVLGRVYGHADWRDLRLRIGIVMSALQASIPAAETALETVVSGRYAQLDLWARPTAADRTAARRWLRFLGVRALADRPWAFISQGERQRVLIARALMAHPRLLILDEPCGGLDPLAREEFVDFVERLSRRRRGPVLVLVTHHVEEITPGFTHALVLRRGAAFASGPVRRVVTSAVLSGAFGARMTVAREGGRFRSRVTRA
ncbi:MAG: ABC transporter ATP-binding protein [Opitutaceae bacterium]